MLPPTDLISLAVVPGFLPEALAKSSLQAATNAAKMDTNLTEDVDLLIVGAGPSGLMLATWASQFDITARIIDDKHERVQTGHADGLHSRTVEILHSFGLADRVLSQASRINEICSWV